LSNHIYVY